MKNALFRLISTVCLSGCALLSEAVFGGPPGPSFGGIPSIIHQVVTPDGATENVYELVGNETATEVVLIEPGLMENAKTMDRLASAWRDKGFKVLIGQVRLAGPKGFRSTGGLTNRLEDVLLKDFPTHLRKAIEIAGERKVHVLGHSMGGLATAATFSDTKLAAEFLPHMGSITLLNTPVDFEHVSPIIRLQLKALLPVLKKVRSILAVDSVDTTSTVFDLIERMKASHNPLVKASAGKLEHIIIQMVGAVLNRTVVDADHSSDRVVEQLLKEELSTAPLEILMSFGDAIARGQFLGADGRQLLRPERLTSPMQVVAAGDDIAAPSASSKSFFRRIGSKVKRLARIEGVKHVSLVVSNELIADVMPKVLAFHTDPVATAAEANEVEWTRSAGPARTLAETERNSCLRRVAGFFGI